MLRSNISLVPRSHQNHPAAMKWREYHESTKHSIESLAHARHGLDWENMPDPFRHYKGVPVLDLPADPPEPEMPALAVLRGRLWHHTCRRRTNVSLSAPVLLRRN